MLEWEVLLQEDEDKEFLGQGVHYGFKLIEEGTKLPQSFSKNHKSALGNFEAAQDIIVDEINKGRYVVCDGWTPDIISPLGLVPKSNGSFRLIHDCSVPHGEAVNDFTIPGQVSV